MKKILFILMTIACWYACSEDEPGIPEIQGISFSDFLDTRDSSVYRCMTIGGQTWMAENLRYRHPWGSFSGCYSYEEGQLDSTDFMADAARFYEIVNNALNEGTIVAPDATFKSRLNLVSFGMWDVIQFCSYCETTYTDVALISYLNRVKNELEVESRADIAALNLLKAEEENGGYKDRYGYLYTYDAAKTALPEGWRLPTDEDWKKLEQALGMGDGEINRMEAWRGAPAGRLLKAGEEGIGFDVSLGGGRLYGGVGYGSLFRNREGIGYYWTSTETRMNDSTSVAVIRKFTYNEDRIFRGTAKLYQAAYSIRGIKK